MSTNLTPSHAMLVLLLLSIDYQPSTMRQTQVMVIPSVGVWNRSFVRYDRVVQALQQARRNARQYYGASTMTMTTTMPEEEEEDAPPVLMTSWNVAIHCAHLHPTFGEEPPPPATATTTIIEEAEAAADRPYAEYKRNRLAARRSPYPTMVMEIRVAPTLEYGTTTTHPPHPQHSTTTTPRPDPPDRTEVQKLEALLLSTTAHIKPEETTTTSTTTVEQEFWKAMGSSIPEIITRTPVQLAQQWITEQQQLSSSSSLSTTVSFTTSSTSHVDAAFEFVLTNIAMLLEQATMEPIVGGDDSGGTHHEECTPTPTTPSLQYYYCVLPNFLLYSATSLEKFAGEVQNIMTACCDTDIDNGPHPDLLHTPDDRNNDPTVLSSLWQQEQPPYDKFLSITTYHPEHVLASQRSPVPMVALLWNSTTTTSNTILSTTTNDTHDHYDHPSAWS
jgi:hypothetical protein